MCLVYLDWNIFNKLEKLDQLTENELPIYANIKEQITARKIIAPYSNAHISDLSRGYLKNPAFGDTHINTIQTITNDLCIVQYWGEQKVKWHTRDPKEFLESTLTENHFTANSFAELMSFEDEPLLTAAWELHKAVLRLTSIDESFKQIYKADPIFNSIFPRTKTEMNKLALCEDLFQFSSRIKTDYALYRNFQKFLTQLRLKLPQYQKLYSQAQIKVIGKPAYLTWEAMVDQATAQFKHTSPNTAYDRIVNLFTSTDLKGYSPDEKFANLIDDALHCFYAAHCDYFITIDKRCSDKARKVYEKLRIKTKVVTPAEFIESNEYV